MSAYDEFLDEIRNDPEGALLTMRATSKLVAYYERLLESFELDSLTGLPGSNKYHEYRDHLEKHPPPSAGVIVFDVNDLKYYNDNKGHQSGDLLLQKAAESFHHICAGNTRRRASDAPAGQNVRVFRTGGDEFVALVANCSEMGLNNIIAAWQEKLAKLNSAADGIRCTIAHGSAFADGDYKLADALQLADERMYAEKRRMKELGLKLGDVR